MTNPSEDVVDIYDQDYDPEDGCEDYDPEDDCEDYDPEKDYDPEDDHQTDTEAIDALYGINRDYRDYLDDEDWHFSA